MMKKEKKTSGVQLLIRMVVKDPDGKVLSDTGQKPSKSFVIQFLEFLWIMFRAVAGTVSITATDGTEDEVYRNIQYPDKHFQVNAPANNSNYGVVVGTGDTAETNTDFKLDTQLTEGVGLGNITHGGTTIGTAAVVGANVDIPDIMRAFTNSTGLLITVEEAGIYFTQTAYVKYFCMVRDVLPASIDIPNNCSLTVYYTFRTTV